jgi:hypothetical protein
MIFHCAQLSHPPTHWHAETCPYPGRGPSYFLYLSLEEWPRLPFTARIERYICSFQARSFSLQGWGLIDLPLRASNEGSPRPRVARAQKIIRLHPLLLTIRWESVQWANFFIPDTFSPHSFCSLHRFSGPRLGHYAHLGRRLLQPNTLCQ